MPVLAVSLLVVSAVLVLWFAQRPPRIDVVMPGTIAAGDTVTIEGAAFGSTGRISLDNRLVPGTMIQRWTGQLIVFSMPAELRSGLLSVTTDSGTSNTVFVTLEEDLPVVVGRRGPIVTSLRPQQLSIGYLLQISGRSFGHRSSISQLTLSGARGDISVPASDPHIVFWSEEEIRLVVPDTVSPGVFSISINDTPVDASIEIRPWDGDREFGQSTRFAVRIAVVVDGADEGIFAVMPSIPVFPTQPAVQLLRESAPSAATPLARGVVYAFSTPDSYESAESSTSESVEEPQRFERVVLVDRRAVRWDLDGEADSEVLLEPWFRNAFRAVLGDGSGIPTDAPEIVDLRRQWVELTQSVRGIIEDVHATTIASLEPAADGTDDPLAAITGEEAASPMGYATLAVALARNAGVPARRHFGLLVEDGGNVIPHVWVEFFLPGVGWIPADPAVGDGMLEEEARSVVEFYGEDLAAGTLGAIDGHRVSIAIDGEEIVPLYPSGSTLEHDSQWAYRALRIESPWPEFPEDLAVRWEDPELFVGVE